MDRQRFRCLPFAEPEERDFHFCRLFCLTGWPAALTGC
jgi:hypothetical protein